jgi:hypothetical protein
VTKYSVGGLEVRGKVENGKAIIDEKALTTIGGIGIKAFHDIQEFGTLDTKGTSAYLILSALSDYLESHGIVAPFELKVNRIVKNGD